MRRSPISDRELRIAVAGNSLNAALRDSRSGIRKGKSFLLGAFFLVTGVALTAAPQPTTPTPTPTPRPRLTGGFGRAAATPISSETNGQALSDVVRAATESKTPKKPKPSVAITNDNLVTDPKKGRLTTMAPRSVPPTPAGKALVGATSTPAPPAVPSEGSEAEWRERARALRRQVEEGKARVYQLEGDAAALEKDFYRWDDGQYRDGVIKPAWEKKKQELEETRKELAAAEKDLADLPELARKAGALPGWIRE
jgi:hypothetical protein